MFSWEAVQTERTKKAFLDSYITYRDPWDPYRVRPIARSVELVLARVAWRGAPKVNADAVECNESISIQKTKSPPATIMISAFDWWTVSSRTIDNDGSLAIICICVYVQHSFVFSVLHLTGLGEWRTMSRNMGKISLMWVMSHNELWTPQGNIGENTSRPTAIKDMYICLIELKSTRGIVHATCVLRVSASRYIQPFQLKKKSDSIIDLPDDKGIMTLKL